MHAPEETPPADPADASAAEASLPGSGPPSADQSTAESPTAAELDALRAGAARADELAERIKRIEAEFVNETRRIRKRAEDERKFAVETVVVDLLPVLDALHSARKELGDADDAHAAIRQGLDLVGRQLRGVLERHGVSEIGALGLAFDPVRHEALLMLDRPDLPPQSVCDVLRPGYELNGRVVRAAEVIVVRPPPPTDAGGPAPGTSDAPTDAPPGDA